MSAADLAGLAGTGLRTQSAAIRRLAAQGIDPQGIAARLGCPVNTVQARLSEARKAAGTPRVQPAAPGRREKPTHGHPTRTAAIQAMLAAGHNQGEVARALGIAKSTVSDLVCAARRRAAAQAAGPVPAPVVRDGSGRPRAEILLNYDLMRSLRPHARCRDLTVRAVALEIVEAVVERGLVDMVLQGREF